MCCLRFKKTQCIKNSFNNSKQRRIALSSCKKLSTLVRGITSKLDGGFY